MPEATWYSQGAFCWSELATNDVEGARAFYTRVFGLETEDSPTVDGGSYVQFHRGGKYVAGLTDQQPQEREQGVPPHWNTYIAADDVDAVTAKAEELGAKILAPPFDVLEMGRMAVAADPTGAPIGFWQGKSHIGAQVYAEDGTMGWFELMTHDLPGAVDFYRGLFGYEVQEFPSAGGPYMVLRHKDENAAGIMAAPQPEIPAAWTPYFQVADAEATFEAATASGAGPMMPVTDMEGVGRVAWVSDPQGAPIAFIEPSRSEG